MKASFPDVRDTDIKEDWEARTITFELFEGNGEVTFRVPKNLQVFGNDVTMTIKARGDNRYQDQGSLGVVMAVTLHDVLFPEQPMPRGAEA